MYGYRCRKTSKIKGNLQPVYTVLYSACYTHWNYNSVDVFQSKFKPFKHQIKIKKQISMCLCYDFSYCCTVHINIKKMKIKC